MEGRPFFRKNRPIGWILVGGAIVAALTAFHLATFEEVAGNSHDLIPQWTLARLAVTGHLEASYSYAEQAALIRRELPPHKRDLLDSSHISGVGVSPYPPTMMVLFAPLGHFSYDTAAQIVFLSTLALSFVAAGAIAGATFGQIGFFMASIAILTYPGFLYNLLLGQNAMLTLALMSLGWCGLVRRWEWVAGIAWGLLLYKPQWFVAVFWLPILLRRWRVVAAMLLTAAWMIGLATFWLGPESWSAWFTQVRTLDAIMYVDADFRGWLLGMACDLRGVINRYLPGSDWARAAGWAALAAIGLIGIVGTRRALDRPREPLAAEPESVVWLATACLIIPYLYYYDQSVFLLPLLVAWSHRSRIERWQIVLLALVTIGYYVALPVMMYREAGPFTPRAGTNPDMPAWTQPQPGGWLGGPPWATIVVVALWLLALTFRSPPEEDSR